MSIGFAIPAQMLENRNQTRVSIKEESEGDEAAIEQTGREGIFELSRADDAHGLWLGPLL